MSDQLAQLLERLAELEKRVQATEDIEAIKALHQTYIRKLADRDWEGMADFFAEDAVTDIRWHGRTENRQELIENVFEELHGLVKSKDGYILSSPVITVDGDTGYGEWTWHRHVCDFRTFGGMMRVWGPWLEGRYKCKYTKIDGEWKFQDMWFRVVLPDADPSAEEMKERLAQADPHVVGATWSNNSPLDTAQ